jgi:hypothetical protein
VIKRHAHGEARSRGKSHQADTIRRNMPLSGVPPYVANGLFAIGDRQTSTGVQSVILMIEIRLHAGGQLLHLG